VSIARPSPVACPPSLTQTDRPILIRDGIAPGQDLTTRITSVSGTSATLATAPSQGLTGTVYAVKGWKNVVEFLSGTSQTQNAQRFVLGNGSAHYCKSDLWAGGRPGVVGLIEQTGRYSRASGSDAFVGTSATRTVTHSLINTPKIVVPVQAGGTMAAGMWVFAKAARDFTVRRQVTTDSGLPFDWLGEM